MCAREASTTLPPAHLRELRHWAELVPRSGSISSKGTPRCVGETVAAILMKSPTLADRARCEITLEANRRAEAARCDYRRAGINRVARRNP
jgi:coproporphyrinogen III oxidase-like Fe-S oxidoreductase